MRCIETSVAVIQSCCQFSSNRHMRCIETRFFFCFPRFYKIEPTHEMYWNNIRLYTFLQAFLIEPTHEMYWNSSNRIVLFRLNLSNRHMRCIETVLLWLFDLYWLYRTDTWDVLKPKLNQLTGSTLLKSNRHMRCIETKYQHPTQSVHIWSNRHMRCIETIVSFYLLIKVKKSNRHMRCIETRL